MTVLVMLFCTNGITRSMNGDINTIVFTRKGREPKWPRLLTLREPFSVYGSFGYVIRVFIFTVTFFFVNKDVKPKF